MPRRTRKGKAKSVADAAPQNWVDRHAPAWLLPYLRLARADRPIGFYLLALPCFWSVALAGLSIEAPYPDPFLLLLFAIGAVAMRAAGCTYNDIVDRDIDARVARTRGRPIPSGAVSLRQAWAWLLAQCAIGFWVLLSLPGFARWVALASLPLVALYPFMKRVTWWPQAWLGIVFSWGALVGGAATQQSLAPEILLLYAGCFCWVVGYDTIYALQDIEDDALVGVKSTARLFGERWREWTIGFYAAALFLWAAAARFAGAPWWILVVLAGIGAWIIWPTLQSVKKDDAASALRVFKANALIGLAVLCTLALEPTWRTLRPYIGG